MELRQMIETATNSTHDQATLAKLLGLNPNSLTDAKAGRRGLPEVACGKLAEILGIDRWTVVAASSLVTEKNPAKRAYLTPFVQELPRTAAAWLLGIATAATVSLAPNDAQANDTIEVSPVPAEPCPARPHDMTRVTVPIMRTTTHLINRIMSLARSTFAASLQPFCFSGL